jgi:nicotinate dehydrogenase subunit A
MSVNITVNGNIHPVAADPDTALLYILRNDLGLNGPKFGCGLAQCGACKVLLGKDAVTSCSIPLSGVGDQPIRLWKALERSKARTRCSKRSSMSRQRSADMSMPQ